MFFPAVSHLRSVVALSASQDVDLVSSATEVRELMPSATEGSVESDTLNGKKIDYNSFLFVHLVEDKGYLFFSMVAN